MYNVPESVIRKGIDWCFTDDIMRAIAWDIFSKNDKKSLQYQSIKTVMEMTMKKDIYGFLYFSVIFRGNFFKIYFIDFFRSFKIFFFRNFVHLKNWFWHFHLTENIYFRIKKKIKLGISNNSNFFALPVNSFIIFQRFFLLFNIFLSNSFITKSIWTSLFHRKNLTQSQENFLKGFLQIRTLRPFFFTINDFFPIFCRAHLHLGFRWSKIRRILSTVWIFMDGLPEDVRGWKVLH